MRQRSGWWITGIGAAVAGVALAVFLATGRGPDAPRPTGAGNSRVPPSSADRSGEAAATPGDERIEATTPAGPAPIAPSQSDPPRAVPRWTLRGRCVRRHAGREIPVPRARVEIWRGWDDLGGTLEVVADAEGRFTADLASLRFVPARERRLLSGCLASAPGYAIPDAVDLPDLPLDPSRPYRGNVKLLLRPCAEITGRVVDQRGRPVAGADFQSIGLEADDESDDISSHYREETLEGATFSFRDFVAGRIELRACVPGVGVSRWTPMQVSPPAAVRVPDLVLRPLGVIEGHARFPDGSPASDFDLEFDAVEDVSDTRGAGGLESETHARVRTDAAGRFAVRCLHPGAYTIRPAGRPPDWEPAGVRARTGDLGVVVPIERPVIHVSFRDARGGRMKDGAVVGITTWRSPHAARAAARHAAGLDPLTLENLEGCVRSFAGEPVAVFVLPDSYHHLAVGRDGLAPDRHAVRFVAGKWRHAVEITFRPARGLASLSLRLHDENGAELIDRVATLVPSDPVAPGAWSARGPALAARPLRVKPGRYRLRVAFNFPDSTHGYGMDWTRFRSAFAPVEREVTLRSGGNRLVLHARRQAFLQARCWIDRAAPADQVALIVVGKGTERRVSFFRDSGQWSQGGEPRQTEWLALEPGTYNVTFHRPERPPVQRKVTLHAGGVCPLKF